MGLKINKVGSQNVKLVAVDKDVYISRDESKVIDPKKENGLLLARKGQRIPEAKAKALGLLKEAKKPANKARKPAEDK